MFYDVDINDYIHMKYINNKYIDLLILVMSVQCLYFLGYNKDSFSGQFFKKMFTSSL